MERIIEDLIICVLVAVLIALIVQLVFPGSGIFLSIPCIIPFIFVFPTGLKHHGGKGRKG